MTHIMCQYRHIVDTLATHTGMLANMCRYTMTLCKVVTEVRLSCRLG